MIVHELNENMVLDRTYGRLEFSCRSHIVWTGFVVNIGEKREESINNEGRRGLLAHIHLNL